MKKTSLILLVAIILIASMTLMSCDMLSNLICKCNTTTTTVGNGSPNGNPTTTTGDRWPNNNPTTTIPTTTNPNDGPNGDVVSGDYTLGMGITFDEITNAQMNMTVAAVVLDAQGKILACRIDVVHNKYTINYDNEEIEFKNWETKMELGDRFGMGGMPWAMDNDGDGRVLEWYQQALAFEQYVVGKTVDEIAAMTTTSVNNRLISTDADLLSAGCTIQITEFLEAVIKACNDEQAFHFEKVDEFVLGLGVNSENDGSNFDDNGAVVKVMVEFAASVVVDGKIVASLNDAAQPQARFDWDGKGIGLSVGKGDGILKTKRELKEDYLMSKYFVDNNGDGVSLEWYLQSAAFSAHVVGMTGAEVTKMSTQLVNSHYISNDADLLNAGCTIQITGMKAVVAESAVNAR